MERVNKKLSPIFHNSHQEIKEYYAEPGKRFPACVDLNLNIQLRCSCALNKLHVLCNQEKEIPLLKATHPLQNVSERSN